MTNVKTLLLVVLVALGGFALGRLSIPQAEAESLANDPAFRSQERPRLPLNAPVDRKQIVYTSSPDGKTIYIWGSSWSPKMQRQAVTLVAKGTAR